MTDKKDVSKPEQIDDDQLENVKGGLSYTSIKTTSLSGTSLDGARFGKRFDGLRADTDELSLRHQGISKLGVRK